MNTSLTPLESELLHLDEEQLNHEARFVFSREQLNLKKNPVPEDGIRSFRGRPARRAVDVVVGLTIAGNYAAIKDIWGSVFDGTRVDNNQLICRPSMRNQYSCVESTESFGMVGRSR